jgi:Uma2 family endonuclease
LGISAIAPGAWVSIAFTQFRMPVSASFLMVFYGRGPGRRARLLVPPRANAPALTRRSRRSSVPLRRSYVVWQEGRSPEVVVELLSPGTEAGDLGRFLAGAEPGEFPSPFSSALVGNGSSQEEPPPEKFTVYERYLRIPYYGAYNRYSGILRFFQLVGGRDQEQPLLPGENLKIWLPGLAVGLGIWQGEGAGAVGAGGPGSAGPGDGARGTGDPVRAHR